MNISSVEINDRFANSKVHIFAKPYIRFFESKKKHRLNATEDRLEIENSKMKRRD